MNFYKKTNYNKYVQEILNYVRDKGLDPKDTIFIPVENETLFYVISNLYPVALPHWSRGRDYLRVKSSNERGSTYYEVVFNTSPYAIAYMSELSSHADTLVVIAHVFGHTHIFKHNIYEYNDHDVLPRMKNALSIYEEKIGLYSYEELDVIVDFVNALWNVIYDVSDININFASEEKEKQEKQNKKDFLKFTNTRIFKETPKEKYFREKEEERREKYYIGKPNFYEYIVENSPIEDWMKELVRAELELKKILMRKSVNKIVHEGFASWIDQLYIQDMLDGYDFLHSIILSSRIAFPDINNPYWLGFKLLKFAEEVDKVFLPEFVKQIDDYELISRYFNYEFLIYLSKNLDGFVDATEINELKNEERIKEYREAFLSRLLVKRPLVYISEYDVNAEDDDTLRRYRIVKVVEENFNAPLKLESPDKLDFSFAFNTIKKIAKIWKGPVYLRYAR